MGIFNRLFGNRPPAVTPAPKPAPRTATPAEQRTGFVSDTNVARLSRQYSEEYPVPAVVEGPHAVALLHAWVANRPDREFSAFLFAEPDGTVTIREPDRTALGTLSETDAGLYHPLIVALAGRGLTAMVGAKFVGGTGKSQRVRLELQMDAPAVIASDFGINLNALPAPTPDHHDLASEPRVKEDSGPPPPWRHVPDDTRGHGFIGAVGESHYQETLRSLDSLFVGIGRTDRNFQVRLVPEPENPHDPNAVSVRVGGGERIGYLDADLAAEIQRHIIRYAGPVWCPARLVGGGDEAIGVVLDFVEVKKLKTWRPKQ